MTAYFLIGATVLPYQKILIPSTITGTKDLQIWLKFTDTCDSDVFPIAIFNENMMLNISTVLLFVVSICLGFIVLRS